MDKDKVLAIDASTKRSGIAWFNTAGELAYEALSETSADVYKRIVNMKNDILSKVKEHNFTTVIMEEVRQDGYNNHTAKMLLYLQAVIVISLYEYNPKIKVEFIGASSWRSKLRIQGYRMKRDAQKIMDINYANQTYNLSLSATQDDEADAIGILTAYTQGAEVTKIETTKKSKIGSEESAF